LRIKKTEIYRAIILLVVLYGRDTSSGTVREDNGQRLLENRVLRKVFGPKTEKVEAGWRKLHNDELHDLCFSPGIIRVIKSGRWR
jgi:hypothetical protein